MEIFGTDIDLNNNEAKNFRVENGISLPTPGVGDSGLTFFNSGDSDFYGWTGTLWKKLSHLGSSDVFRKSDLTTPATSYTEQIHHNGNLVLNGVSRDNAYSNAFGSTLIVGTLGLQGNTIQTENITSWLNVRGNQGLRLQQVNQNVGFIQIGNTSLGTMSGNQTNDSNVQMGRNWTTTASQTSNPNWRNLTLNSTVNYTGSVAATKTFYSIYVAPSLTSVDEHFALYGTGMIKLTDYGSGTITGTVSRFAAFDGSGKVIEQALGASGSFTAQSGETVTVVNGLITSIV